MNGLQAVEDMALYLHENQSVRVFKFEKTTGYRGEYIAVNHLPFTFGQAVNENNALNVNLHVPSLSKGVANIPRLTNLLGIVTDLIPYESAQEEDLGLNLHGCYYSISSISQPMEDKDGTHFINIKVKSITNQIKL